MAVNYDFNFTLAGVCPAILAAAKDYAKQNYAMNLGAQLGALDFILSPQNGSIKTELSQAEGGKKVIQARVTYKQRSLQCDVQDGEDAKDVSICDTPAEPTEKSVTVSIDDAIATTPKMFTNANMVQICQNTMSWIQEFLDSELRAAREKLSRKVLAKIAANRGVNKQQFGGDAAATTWVNKTIIGFANSQAIPLTGNFNDVLMDYQNNKFNGIPAIIGDGNLQTYATLAGLACCNSVTPYADALAKAGWAFYLDQQATSVLGPNDGSNDSRALLVAYGASHLIWFNPNENISIQPNGHIAFITIPDPVYPALRWDMTMKFDECEERWVYFFRAAFDVFNVFQSDSFKQNDPTPACDDELFGVKGIWGYQFHRNTS